MSGSGGSPIGIGIGIWSGTLGAGVAPVTPSWVLTADGAPAAVDFDFANNRAYVLGAVGTPDSFLTCTRATTRYVLNSSGSYVSVAINTLGYTYDPTTLTALGVWIEEARTNSIRNNGNTGTVVGTPGTLPTNWSTNLDATLAVNVISFSTENGIDYVDLQLVGVSTGTTTNTINFESTTGITATTAQTWAESVFVRQIAGTLTGISTIRLRQTERTSGGVFVADNDSSPLTIATTGNLRSCVQSLIATLSGGGTVARVQPRLTITTAAAGVVDITLRIGWPQLELGASVTSPIRTTTVAVTRNADNVFMSVPAPLQNLLAYTLFGKGTPNNPTTYGVSQLIFSISGATSADRATIGRNLTTGAYIAQTVSGGVTIYNQTNGTWNQSTEGSVALRMSDTSLGTTNRAARNPSTLFTSGTIGVEPVPPMLTFNIGSRIPTATSPFDGTVKECAFFNFGATDAALQALVP